MKGQYFQDTKLKIVLLLNGAGDCAINGLVDGGERNTVRLR